MIKLKVFVVSCDGHLDEHYVLIIFMILICSDLFILFFKCDRFRILYVIQLVKVSLTDLKNELD